MLAKILAQAVDGCPYSGSTVVKGFQWFTLHPPNWGPVWLPTYHEHDVALQKQYLYLGVLMHETRGLAGAADALAAAGSKAMHAGPT